MCRFIIFLFQLSIDIWMEFISILYITTIKIPGKRSLENMISSHVKM